MEAPLRGPLITILPWRHPGHYISCLATDSLAPKFNAQCTGCARRLGLTDEQVSGGSTYGSGVEGNILWRVLSISLYGNIAWIFLHHSICGIGHSSVWNKMFPYWSIYFVSLERAYIVTMCASESYQTGKKKPDIKKQIKQLVLSNMNLFVQKNHFVGSIPIL